MANLLMESALLINGLESVSDSRSTFPDRNGPSGKMVMEYPIVAADVGKEIGVILKFWDPTLGERSAGLMHSLWKLSASVAYH